MKYLRNPITQVVAITTPLAAKKLASYGWERVTREDYLAYVRANVQLAIMRNISTARPRLGRVQ